MKRLAHLLTLLLITTLLSAQNSSEKSSNIDSLRVAQINSALELLIERDSLYKKEIDISIGKVPLQELVRNIAQINEVNISVRDNNNTIISCNFNRIRIYELLFFLCKEYQMNLDITGNIVSLFNRPPPTAPKVVAQPQYQKSMSNFTGNELLIDSLGLITARISSGNIKDIITDVCNQLKLSYFFIQPLRGVTALTIDSATVKTLFNTLLTGTSYSYYMEEGIYFFGELKDNRALTSVRIIPFTYRSVDKLSDVIPLKLREGVQIESFADLNSMIVSGDERKVARVEHFLKSIDKTVPLINIDIIIVDVNKSRDDEAGISVGKGAAAVPTQGTVSPGIDINIGGNFLNKIFNSFNGFGAINLGSMPQGLYINLKFLEATGDIVVESTPKLSTLNGQEAILESGETQYYKEVQNTYMGTQNPVQSTSYNWKSVDANLTIKITPYMSADSLITMNIEIVQKEFTPRIEKDAPPGIASRSFKSIIRVSNGEVVLLGGIERNVREKSSKGLPGVSRIPVLKWLFGRAKDYKNESKLNVFIRPSIIP